MAIEVNVNRIVYLAKIMKKYYYFRFRREIIARLCGMNVLADMYMAKEQKKTEATDV